MSKLTSMAKDLLTINEDFEWRLRNKKMELVDQDIFDLHIFEQWWPDTSCGFGGVAGQAFTKCNVYAFVPKAKEDVQYVNIEIPSDVITFSENLLLLKDLIKHNNYSTLEFLKLFERKKRLELVDILRGAKPIQIDFLELKKIAENLNMSNNELFSLWKSRMIEYLKEGGFNIEKNKKLLDTMFNCANSAISSVN